jgi:hypothetical protein
VPVPFQVGAKHARWQAAHGEWVRAFPAYSLVTSGEFPECIADSVDEGSLDMGSPCEIQSAATAVVAAATVPRQFDGLVVRCCTETGVIAMVCPRLEGDGWTAVVTDDRLYAPDLSSDSVVDLAVTGISHDDFGGGPGLDLAERLAVAGVTLDTLSHALVLKMLAKAAGGCVTNSAVMLVLYLYGTLDWSNS